MVFEDKLLVLALLAFTAFLAYVYAPFKVRRLVDETPKISKIDGKLFTEE